MTTAIIWDTTQLMAMSDQICLFSISEHEPTKPWSIFNKKVSFIGIYSTCNTRVEDIFPSIANVLKAGIKITLDNLNDLGEITFKVILLTDCGKVYFWHRELIEDKSGFRTSIKGIDSHEAVVLGDYNEVLKDLFNKNIVSDAMMKLYENHMKKDNHGGRVWYQVVDPVVGVLNSRMKTIMSDIKQEKK